MEKPIKKRRPAGRPKSQPPRRCFSIYVTPEAIEKFGPRAAIVIRDMVEAQAAMR